MTRAGAEHGCRKEEKRQWSMSPPEANADRKERERKRHRQQQAGRSVVHQDTRESCQIRQLSVCPLRLLSCVTKRGRDLALAFGQKVEIGYRLTIERLVDCFATPFVHV